MILKETVDLIIETARIEEVVGDFVSLKRRGANMLGNCPFHTEKTPSFTVSPAKGIYKCFGCGKAGDSVKFVMEHESYSYPEALRYLAEKYRIEIEEEKPTVEQIQKQDEKESLYVLTSFAQKFYSETLFNTEEGKAVGLSYFHERGFNESTIKKFQLGYALNKWDSLTEEALRNNFTKEILDKSGLVVVKDKDVDVTSAEKPAQRFYDRFRNRVIFPVHNLTGRVIAFGARILQTDPKSPKYINSPETEIYHKSKSLYGIFFARKAIAQLDECLLVEGYTDVISLHQAGVENVVASSGTSLTQEQIRLIARFTKNVTILYDGDAAGIKASLRGIDLILEEGLNVKVVLFPDGHDPDSYMRNFGTNGFKKHIEENKKDFILYKTDILLKEAGNDPIKKSEVIREIVESVAKIPDSIKASVFIKECSSLLKIDERALLSELNKMRMAKAKKDSQQQISRQAPVEELPVEEPQLRELKDDASQEKEIIRLLLLYGNRVIDWDGIANTYIGPFMIAELSDVEFEDPTCKTFVEIYRKEVENGVLPEEQHFIHYPDKDIVDLTVTLIATKYTLSENWYEMHKILVPDEQVNMKATILGAIFHLKKQKVGKILESLRKELQTTPSEADQEILLNQYMHMKKVEKTISDYLGSVILK